MIDPRSLSCFARMSPARESSSSVLLLVDQITDHSPQRERDHCGEIEHKQKEDQVIDSSEDDEAESGGRRSRSCFPSSLLQSWLFSLLLARRMWSGFGDPRRNKNKKSRASDVQPAPAMVAAADAAVWKKMVSVIDCRRRQMAAMTTGIGLRRKKSKDGIDFAYDEHSYAKNFDMGRENWIKYDPCWAPVWRTNSGVPTQLRGSSSSSIRS